MNMSYLCRLIAFPALMVVAGCATTGHPCFSDRVMFPDKTASCQYGRSYRCDNGDWIANRTACTEATTQLASSTTLPGSCEYAGLSFASGSASCNAGTQYRCVDGRWHSLDLPCTAGSTALPVAPRGQSCSYQGSTIASSSTICQSGSTFLCNNGEWINLGTVCS